MQCVHYPCHLELLSRLIDDAGLFCGQGNLLRVVQAALLPGSMSVTPKRLEALDSETYNSKTYASY